MAANADELYLEMLEAVKDSGQSRESSDQASPMQKETYEAHPFQAFFLEDPEKNLTTVRKVDLRWAAANTLHFFAATEDAAPLRKYNRLADKFLTGDQFVGAYGFVAMPQVEKCVELLKENPSSRRAIVIMNNLLQGQDINRPSCWCSIHFLVSNDLLWMHCYQRSMNLTGVMPYDLVALTNIQVYVAKAVGVRVGIFCWTVGSLHEVKMPDLEREAVDKPSLILPWHVLWNSGICWHELCEPFHVEELK